MNRRDFLCSATICLANTASWRMPDAMEGAAMSLRTLDGSSTRVDRAALAELEKGMRGEILIEGMSDYDSARSIWNAAIDRKPAVIIKCANTDDVVHAVRFARRHNALLSVRSGGHNAVGFAVCDGGVIIDLTLLNNVEVDPARTIAKVGGGTTFGRYDAATAEYGLASTGPIISLVGVGGYTLGGGIGWLHRKIGLACDNLVSAQVVTADAEVLTASVTSNPDVYWAIRGGGGNFGIVPSFEFRLSPVRGVFAGLIFHPLEDLPKVAAFVRDFNANAPDDACVWLTMRKAPPSPALPKEMHGRPVATIAVCYAGALEEGEKSLKPLRQFGSPLIDLVQQRSYPDWQSALDSAWGNGFRNEWVGHYLPELTDAAAQTMLEHVSKVTSPLSDVKLATLGGAIARVGENDTAFGHRESKYALVIQTRWKNAGDSAQNLTWIKDFFGAMKAHSTGKVYVNFVADEGEKRVADAYNTASFKRLQRVKAKYDPSNFFRMNQNIRPAKAAVAKQ